jgi:hypothetical protein
MSIYTNWGNNTQATNKTKNTKLPTQPLLTTNGNNNQQINTTENIEQKKKKRGQTHIRTIQPHPTARSPHLTPQPNANTSPTCHHLQTL